MFTFEILKAEEEHYLLGYLLHKRIFNVCSIFYRNSLEKRVVEGSGLEKNALIIGMI